MEITIWECLEPIPEETVGSTGQQQDGSKEGAV